MLKSYPDDYFAANTVHLNRSYPWTTLDKNFGYRARFNRKQIPVFDLWNLLSYSFFHHRKYLINGARLMFHDVNEFPFKTSQLHYAPYLKTTDFIVVPKVEMIDDSLIIFTPEE